MRFINQYVKQKRKVFVENTRPFVKGKFLDLVLVVWLGWSTIGFLDELCFRCFVYAGCVLINTFFQCKQCPNNQKGLLFFKKVHLSDIK